MNTNAAHNENSTLSGTRSIILGFSTTQVSKFIVNANEYLFETAEKASADRDQRQYFELREFLEKNSAQLEKNLSEEISKSYSACFETTTTSNNRDQNASDDLSESDFSLVDEAEMEVSVAIKSIASRVESECADSLYAIEQRIALLNKGVKPVENETPYSPYTFCEAFKTFISSSELEESIKLLAFKLFQRHFTSNLSSLYEEINQYLINAKVMPNLRFKTTQSQPRRRKTDKLIQESEERQQTLYSSLDEILHGQAAPINPQLPMMSLQDTIAAIDTLQKQQYDAARTNLLEQASQIALPETNTNTLQQTLDCISALFSLINTDTQVSSPIKTLFSHLQAPYARIALSDRRFLSDPTHEARLLFNALTEASEQWTDADTDSSSEIVQQIKSVITRILTDFKGENNHDEVLFKELLDEFSNYVESFERKVKLTEQRNAQAAKGREKLKENQIIVKEAIAKRVNPITLPQPIISLLNDTWSSYLTYILIKHGEKSKEWQDALKVIDSVIWYIEPKTIAKEIKYADEMREPLLELLEKGMQTIGIDPAEIKSKLRSIDLSRQLATENANETLKNIHEKPQHNSTDSSVSTKDPIKEEKETATNEVKKEPKSNNNPPAPMVSKEIKVVDTSKEQKQLATQEKTQTPKNRIELQKAQEENSALLAEQTIEEEKTPELITSDSATTITKEPPTNNIKEPKKAKQETLDRVMATKFGTEIKWNKPGEKRRLKLTWHNQRTQNCMLSDLQGKEFGIVSANILAVGIEEGWLEIQDQNSKKPIFERMLESITGSTRNQTKTDSKKHIASGS